MQFLLGGRIAGWSRARERAHVNFVSVPDNLPAWPGQPSVECAGQ